MRMQLRTMKAADSIRNYSAPNSMMIGWLAAIILTFIVRDVNGRSADLTPPERFTIESNSIQRSFIEKGRTTIIDPSRSLKRVFLSNRTVTCNDGSQAGFYLRKSLKSKRWVVFFEGGWYCYDLKSCRSRWMRLRPLMTSAQWPETRDVGGILSPMQDDNPYWHDANHVLVPYCSSDSWSGTKIHPEARDGWSFMGSLIVRQVIADLIPLGLGRSQGGELLMAGSSAGGLGVMLNLDKVKRFLRAERDIKITVRGVSDSGWFLDREPYAPNAISTVDVVKQGWKLWGGALPDACVAKHATEPWRCYFGHRLYPTLKSPLFVFQWLFDEAQMRADSVGAPVTPQQWDYIHEMGAALRSSLDNVTAVFAPSCIGHAVLTKRDWLNIKIDDISLVDALRCWERSTRKHKGKGKGLARRNSDGSQKNRRERIQLTNSDGLNGNGSSTAATAMILHRQRHRLTKEERIRRRQNMTEEERERRRLNRIRKSQQQNGRNVNQNDGDGRRRNAQHKNANRQQEKPQANNARQLGGSRGDEAPSNGKPNQNNNRKRRRNRNNENGGRNVPHRKKFTEPKRCSLRLLERCSWPQCNHSCPALTNPLTGEEMRFLELLSSFGLDIEAVATALGIDMQTLNNMDHAELVNLLTQQVS